MRITNTLDVGRVFFALTILVFFYGVVQWTIRYLHVRRFKRKHKCLPARRVPQAEGIIGLRAFLDLKRDRQRRISLQETTRRAHQYGRTTTAVVLGTQFLSTCDPENIQALLATNFADFSIGPRIHVLGPLLERGIFTLDDVPWQHSRVGSPFRLYP